MTSVSATDWTICRRFLPGTMLAFARDWNLTSVSEGTVLSDVSFWQELDCMTSLSARDGLTSVSEGTVLSDVSFCQELDSVASLSARDWNLMSVSEGTRLSDVNFCHKLDSVTSLSARD